MIVVTVQYIDETTVATNNGGTSLQFYNLDEAKLFARNESQIYPGSSQRTAALCKVYNDGEIEQVWQNGTDITG
jgi:hypothetical protein